MEKEIGKVVHFFDKISVAVVKLTKRSLKVGDKIKIKRKNGQEFEQAVEEMQVEHQGVPAAAKGEEFGLKVSQAVKEGDKVFSL